jgi:PIN domain nuclease of toxin-antitoxin system
VAQALTVLDASALVAELLGEPARPDVDAILRKPQQTSISAVNLAEVVDTLVRGRGHDAADVREKIELLLVAGLEVEPVWLRVMWLATSLRAEHYRRDTAAVSLADCICIATAITLETDLATTDPALARVARAAGVDVIALPDSMGKRP